MSDSLAVLVVLATGTYVMKSAGPLVLGGRRLPPSAQSLVDLLPAALLASLTLVSTFSVGERLVLDARMVGLTVAAIALWRRLPFVMVVVLASMATALLRLLT